MGYIRLIDLETELRDAIAKYGLAHFSSVHIAVVYNANSRSRAVARIWGLSKIFQETFGLKPMYVIELLRGFEDLTCSNRVKVIAHELAHIPTTASGAVRPHNRAFWRDYRLYSRLFTCGDFPSLKK
ncbi:MULTISPECIES: putative metallopeptidase [Pyrobaculum]|uniref:Metallopeptidase n=2 Tax=Pyrobaculum arsenaticum TaxID=121277 RepID=A0A7L4PB70_9CREN|nr:putative metallopeptidase [Pyrobaculum arsenaticum]ABP51613.1 conserved hypothetical protein [Pyrobaculum arsenaticum DSM 13514]MCY0890905.1 putative metallopeptidase [Pyrobaculum arsenaticum]NYR15933.1 metallopeptidase [Pyrobaculum arsenaticum]